MSAGHDEAPVDQPASFAFTEENLEKARAAMAKYPPGRQAIHPRPGGQADEQPGQPRGRGQHADDEGAGVQHDDRDQRNPDQRHGVAELADGLADPQHPEAALPQQPAEPAPVGRPARRTGSTRRHRPFRHTPIY